MLQNYGVKKTEEEERKSDFVSEMLGKKFGTHSTEEEQDEANEWELCNKPSSCT